MKTDSSDKGLDARLWPRKAFWIRIHIASSLARALTEESVTEMYYEVIKQFIWQWPPQKATYRSAFLKGINFPTSPAAWLLAGTLPHLWMTMAHYTSQWHLLSKKCYTCHTKRVFLLGPVLNPLINARLYNKTMLVRRDFFLEKCPTGSSLNKLTTHWWYRWAKQNKFASEMHNWCNET